jgi:hypothetical protein
MGWLGVAWVGLDSISEYRHKTESLGGNPIPDLHPHPPYPIVSGFLKVNISLDCFSYYLSFIFFYVYSTVHWFQVAPDR